LIEKNKKYNISKSAFDDFNSSVLIQNGYTLNSTANWYGRKDASMQYVQYNGAENTLAASILGNKLSDFSTLNDTVFDKEFGSINGNLTAALAYYGGNISSEQTNYGLNARYLPSYGFKCGKNASTKNKWLCLDNTGGEFTYEWHEKSDFAYFYRAITK
jgi:hypothetical protein